MTERLFSFRWDIDHRACMTDGVPRIRALCRELGLANTFFVNLGASTNIREWIGKGFGRSREKFGDREAVHLIEKIGVRRFLVESLLGRPVGLEFVDALERLAREGHELGLHGGMDHVVWSRRFPSLPDDVLEADMTRSHEHFVRHFGPPMGFSSPGFASDDRVVRLLMAWGYRYNGDRIGGRPTSSSPANGRPEHWTVPVTINGPRTIPYLEYHGAIGTTRDDIARDLRRALGDERLVVMYGHPCYEGVHIDRLRLVFETVLDAGFTFVTHGDLVERFDRGERPWLAA
ncbi:MAG: polysaccharide deacetylase family protein [Gemmatimonadetes bacterium]|nr:polysaccharide deacetylase family protein [Gemmatimonadota bacterium]